jgi:hypothetical protein
MIHKQPFLGRYTVHMTVCLYKRRNAMLLKILGFALIASIAIISVSLAWLIYYLLVKLPKLQIAIVEAFSLPSVNYAKSKYPLHDDLDQKKVAIERLRDIFIDFNIMPLGYTSLETAIDNASFKARQDEATLYLEKLKVEIQRSRIAIQNTIPVACVDFAPNTPKLSDLPIPLGGTS